MRTKFGAGLKIILFFIAVIFVLGAFWQFGGPSITGRNRGSSDEVIVKVDGVEISRSAFNAKWNTAMENAKQQGVISLMAFADVRTSTIVGLIQGTRLQQIAADMGVDLSQSKVNAEIEKVVTSALKSNRKIALGTVDKDEEKTDPRDDKKYIQSLSDVKRTVKMQEDEIRSRVPEAEIKANLAQQGIIEKIKGACEKEIDIQSVKDSYKTFSIHQIFLQKGKVSDAQLLTKGKEIVKEARAGTKDFVSLAIANSDLPDKAKGSPLDYSSELSYMLPPEVGKIVVGLKVGQITDPIKTDFGTYIVQLVSIKDKLPAKFDTKTIDARKKMLVQNLQMTKVRDIQKQMDDIKTIEFKDNEFKFLYDVYNVTRKATSMQDANTQLAKACSTFESDFKLNQAADKSKDKKDEVKQGLSDFAKAKYAQVLAQIGQTQKAITILSQMVMGAGATSPSADMSKMLGDLFVQNKEIDKAVKCYQDASDMARFDINLRKSLVDGYKKIGRNDLAAAETTLIAKKESDIKIWEKKNKGSAPALPGQNPSPVPGQMP